MKDLKRYINNVPVKVELDTSMEKILAIQLLYKQVIDVMDTITGGGVINVQSDWNAEEGSEAEILNKPNLATVATSGSYTDLINKPTTLKTFKSSWPTDTTLLELCQTIVSDNDAKVGDMFTGQVACSGLPEDMSNGEITIQVKEGLDNDKLLFITVTSTNLSPYHWERSFYNDEFNNWVSFDLNGAAAAVLGTSEDAGTANTVFGAKAFAIGEISTESAFQKNFTAIFSLVSLPEFGMQVTVSATGYKVAVTDRNYNILIGKKTDNSWYISDDLDDLLDEIISGYTPI